MHLVEGERKSGDFHIYGGCNEAFPPWNGSGIPYLPALYPPMGKISDDSNRRYRRAALGRALGRPAVEAPASILKELAVQ